MRFGFRKLAIVLGALAFWLQPQAGFSVDTPNPTVKITTVLPVDANVTPNKAYMALSGNSTTTADFGREFTDEPTARTECIISGPSNLWSLRPTTVGVKLLSTNDATTALSVSNVASACGEYDLHVKVQWFEQRAANWVSPPGESPRGEISCATNLLLSNIKVDLISVDATSDIGPTKINYRLLPSGVSLPSCTFTAPGMTETRANVSGDFFFTYNQSDLPEGDSIIRLSYLGGNTDLTVTKTPTGKGPASEEVIATLLWEDGGYAGWVNIPITHTISGEGYDRITYSGATVVPESYTLRVGVSHVKIETPHDYPINIVLEKHKYHDANGDYDEQVMALLTGETLPPMTDNLKFYDSTNNRFLRPGHGLTGIAQLDSISFDDNGNTVFPIMLSNEETDQILE